MGGTLVEAPPPVQTHTKAHRPRPVIPIVPVVPRPVEGKRKLSAAVEPVAVTVSTEDTAPSNSVPAELDGQGAIIIESPAQHGRLSEHQGDWTGKHVETSANCENGISMPLEATNGTEDSP